MAPYKPTKSDIDNPCAVCQEIYDGEEEMVECCTCMKWYHVKCTSNAENLTEETAWSCVECTENPTGTLKKNSKAKRKSMVGKKEITSDDLSKTLKEEIEKLKKINEGLVKKNKQLESIEKTTSESDSEGSDKTTRHSLSRFLKQQETKELPHFDGSPNLWPSFYSTYKESEKLFSETANRNRLNKSLSGKALRAVEGLLLTPSTLNEAVEMLKYRFGRSEQLIQEAIDRALEAEQPSEKKPESIVDYAMLVVTISANIKAGGDESEMINPMLIQTLVNRLPFGLQKQWNREKRDLKGQNKIVKISTFSSWLLHESQNYIDLMPIKKVDGKNQHKDKKHINFHRESIVEAQNKPRMWPCSKCMSKNHQLPECREFNRLSTYERLELVKKNHLCFTCLKRGHQSIKCYQRRKGTHPLLKGSDDTKKSENELLREPTRYNHQASKKILGDDSKTKVMAIHKNDSEKILFKIIPVVLYGPMSQINTFAMLDEGSAVTLIEENMANKLDLTGKGAPLIMGWTKEIRSVEKNSKKVTLKISGTSMNSRKYKMTDVRTVKNLALPMQSIASSDICSKYSYLNLKNLPDLEKASPTILIGLDQANLITPLESAVDPEGRGPIATRCKLGWTIHGPENHCKIHQGIVQTFTICECQNLVDENVENLVEKYFELEDFGIKTSNKKDIDSPEVKIAKKILETTTKRIPAGFETGLLWRDSNVKMPDNYNMCLRRLLSIELKMQKNLNFFNSYCEKIKEYVDKGYARKLNHEEVEKICDNMWLLPHFGVSTPNKPKMRFVFDAKAKFGTTSLNSKLLKGPDCYSSLIGVIFKFREGEFAVTADIKEMFHQIKIREQDQRFQCFLWRDGDSQRTPDVYAMRVMIFGATCSPCSAQYIKNLNALEFKDEKSRAVEAITNRFYVDDYLDSFESEETALKITKEVIEINKKCNFDLRNVKSNSKLIRAELGTDEDKELINMNVDEEKHERVLGLYWETKSDNFIFKLNFTKIDPNGLIQRDITKRQLLKIMMSVYDPLGFLSHIMIHAKILLQDVWLKKVDWDEPIPSVLKKRWWNWFDELQNVSKITIPRNYSKHYLSSKDLQLHIFSDASERAFAAAAYVRIEYEGKVEIKLIAAKSKITPQKSNKMLSMPRMELQGAILGTRLSKLIAEEHSTHFISTTYWTDSKTVLSWIHSQNGIFKPYVAHRIVEITNSSQPEQWRYVPSKENPADDATKQTNYDPFEMNCRWFQGPKFLRKTSEDWPADEKRAILLQSDPEVKRVFTISTPEYFPRNYDYTPVDPNRFSQWTDLKRTTAWAKRGLYNWNKRMKKEEQNYLPLSMDELLEAEYYLIKKSQHESFPSEILSLKSQNRLPQKSTIENLSPFIDNRGVMRMESRIERSPQATEDMKKPIIMDRKHQVTKLILMEFHQRFHHQYQEAVVNEIRTRFWIPKLRIAVKETKRRCQQCKNDNATPQAPKMGKLPISRVDAMVGCFHYCGVDLFGPMKVSVRRTKEKVWGVVFTCLTTRAIYIDLVPDLSADSFILTIRNCNSRRGPIKHLYSDCGTNMKGAKSEFQKAIDDIKEERIQRECLKNAIEWHYNPPASPHMGGCWERMVKSIKTVLRKILNERCPKEFVLRSLLCEVEQIVNSRPLTYIALEKDSDDALTPMHFINPFFRSYPPTPGKFNESDLTSRKQWRIIQQLANHFWRRWVMEYLPMLTRSSKWHAKVIPLSIGDIVIVCDNEAPRNQWEKAIVVSVNKANDGQVRSATVRTAHGNLTRPAIKLAKLDVLGKDDKDCERVDINAEKKECLENNVVRRSKRLAIKNTNKTSKLLTLLLTVCFCLSLTISIKADSSNYEIQHSSKGLYIEKLGQAYTIRGKYRIEISTSIDEIFSDQQNCSTLITQFGTICKHVEEHHKESKCSSYLEHIKVQVKNLNTEIMDIISYKARLRRGLLGKTLTAVFGVNDEIYHDLDQLSRNQGTLLEVMKHENVLLCSKINENNQDVEKKLKIFGHRLEEGLASIRYMDKWNSVVDKGMLEVHVHSTFLSAENFLVELQSKYRRYTEILHQRGNILDFLSGSELKEILKNSTNKMAVNLEIYPTPSHQIKLIVAEKSIVVQTYFHIIESDIYEMIHITPIPQKIKDGVFISFKSKYWTFAVNYNKKSYFELSEMQTKECTKDNEIYMCQPNLISNLNTNPNCILDEIYDKYPKIECETVQFSINNTLWKQVAMENTWMFIANKPITVDVICHGERDELIINNTGIVKIKNDCIIKTKKITLKTNINQEHKVKISFHKPSDILNTSSPEIYIKPQSTDELVLNKNDPLFINPVSTIEVNEPNPLPELAKHTTSGLISVLVSIVSCIIIYKYRKSIAKISQCRKKKAEIPETSERRNRRKGPNTEEDIL